MYAGVSSLMPSNAANELIALQARQLRVHAVRNSRSVWKAPWLIECSNGDYLPTRFEAQAQAVSTVFSAKTDTNPESAVGLMTMAGKSQVLAASPSQLSLTSYQALIAGNTDE